MPYKDPARQKEHNRKYYLENRTRILENVKKNYQKTKDKVLAYQKEYYLKNKKRITERNKAYYLRNVDRIRKWNCEYGKVWRKNNKARKNASTYKRRALLRGQLSPDADMEKIKEFYVLAEKLTVDTGIKYTVDHIRPLSKDGLHHEDNLQVIAASENFSKNDQYPYKVSECYFP